MALPRKETAGALNAEIAPSRRSGRVSKLSIERVTKIIRLIRTHGAIPMQRLKQELEVSEASIKRDIEFLRDRLQCPIEWDRSRRGYIIRDDLASGGRFELPGIWFDASEVFALLAMLHLLEGIQPGLLAEHVQPLKTRLRNMLSEGTESVTPIEEKVKLIHFAPRRIEPKHFQLIAGALLRGKRTWLKYWNRDKRQRTEREISPQQLVHYRENWLLDAWCHTQKALRTFALEAIEDVRILDTAAIKVPHAKLQEHFAGGYGIFAGRAIHRARLKFTPGRAQWIAKETWHEDQSSEWLEDGCYLLEVPYANDQELAMDLLRHAPEVEVLYPPELRAKVFTAASAAARKNEPYADE